MTFQFGRFRLDEPARALWLDDRVLQLQPRVFDLLVYLVRNRDRVVPKEELLNALWPGVIVTDNSLQRAVSLLRGALRDGGGGHAIQSFSRNGYKFSPDLDTQASGSDRRSADSSGVDAATEAVLDQRWEDAAALLSAKDLAGQLTSKDLDNWALTLQCLGQAASAIQVLIRAVGAHTAHGDSARAAEHAVTLSMLHLERGDIAVSKGWLARAEDLTREAPASVQSGLALWMRSRIAGVDGLPEEAVAFADSAYAVGRQCKDTRVEALGLVYRGFFKLSLGDTHAGLRDQDHAAALALSNSIDPVTGGILYCNILWACRMFGDWARANQWTLGYQQFCRESGMNLSGSCQLHRAEVLGVRGSLNDALWHIKDSLSRLSDDAPWAVGDAHRVLGDIHAAIGNVEEARKAYETCYALGWSPEPGNAMLLLEQGQADAACSSLERSLIGQGWWTLQRRGMLLAHFAYVLARAGEFDRAKEVIAQLTGGESRWPMPSIRALTSEATGLIAKLDAGDPEAALRHMHLARQLWTSIDCRLNTTRLRLDIAELQLTLQDRNGAAVELHAASSTAKELGSVKLSNRSSALEAQLLTDGRAEHVHARPAPLP